MENLSRVHVHTPSTEHSWTSRRNGDKSRARVSVRYATRCRTRCTRARGAARDLLRSDKVELAGRERPGSPDPRRPPRRGNRRESFHRGRWEWIPCRAGGSRGGYGPRFRARLGVRPDKARASLRRYCKTEKADRRKAVFDTGFSCGGQGGRSCPGSVRPPLRLPYGRVQKRNRRAGQPDNADNGAGKVFLNRLPAGDSLRIYFS